MARPPQPLDPARAEALLATAARHFATKGYEGTSLNTVISEAGWQKSSFYHYFTDKRRLHDHVVDTLASRLLEGVDLPEVDTLTRRRYWPAMTELLAAFGEAATRSPETAHLGRMFHAPVSETDGALQDLRDRIDRWLRQAIEHGRRVGAVRDDLPDSLVVELTLSVLQTLDRWALRHEMHAAGGPQAPGLGIPLVRDLVGRRRGAATTPPAGPR